MGRAFEPLPLSLLLVLCFAQLYIPLQGSPSPLPSGILCATLTGAGSPKLIRSNAAKKGGSLGKGAPSVTMEAPAAGAWGRPPGGATCPVWKSYWHRHITGSTRLSRGDLSEALRLAEEGQQECAAFFLWTCVLEEEWDFMEYATLSVIQHAQMGAPIKDFDTYLQSLRFTLYVHGYMCGSASYAEGKMTPEESSEDSRFGSFFPFLVAYHRLRRRGRLAKAPA
eukprot:jgi/Botrbrau1/17347/Bobra.0015s0092.1